MCAAPRLLATCRADRLDRTTTVLARMELEIALPALLRRFPDLALAIDPEHADHTSGTIVHGLKTLPVTW
jgi:cytochrome P450